MLFRGKHRKDSNNILTTTERQQMRAHSTGAFPYKRSWILSMAIEEDQTPALGRLPLIPDHAGGKSQTAFVLLVRILPCYGRLVRVRAVC